MPLKRNIVQNTNDSAVVSKESMCRKGYVVDPFLRYFDPTPAKEQKRSRSPLINRFYYLRFKAIEYALNRLNELNQIISIGSGFDTSFLRYPNIAFIEIDFPDVAKNKAKILIDNHLIDFNKNSFIENELNFVETNEPIVVLKTDNYCLIGADLRKYQTLCEFIDKQNLVKNVNKETKIGLFNECSLCYVKQDISDNLMKLLIQLYQHKCHSITYIGFEQLKPNQSNDGFCSVMLNHFQTIGSPLKTFLTKAQIIRRFKLGLNFESIEVLDMKTFFDDYIDLKEKQRIDSLEMFDEYEEFDSVCSCYALTIAQKSLDISLKSDELSELYIETKHQIKPILKSITNNPFLCRFGHSSCLTNNKQIVIFGGFGADFDEKKEFNQRISHKRLDNLLTIDTKTDEIISYSFAKKSNEMQRIHSKIVELKEDLFLISGGRQSPSSVLDNCVIKLMSESNQYEKQPIDESLLCVPKVFRHLIVKQLKTNKIIQFGGKRLNTGFGTSADDNVYYVLDTNTMKWQKQMKTNLFSGIHSLSGTSLDSNVFLTNGGLKCDLNTFASNDFVLIDERMSFVNRFKVENMNHLYSHNMNVLNENKIVIIGGIGESGSNNRIDLLDLRSNQIMDSFDITTETPLMLTNFSSELVESNGSTFLWLSGGGGNCFSFGTHFNKLSVLELFDI